MENILSHKYSAPTLQLETVTVYNDRAELKRTVIVLASPGLNTVEVDDLAVETIPDSLRVEGQGQAIIHEVQLHDERIPKHAVDDEKIKTLNEKIRGLKEKKQSVDDYSTILDDQIKALNIYIKHQDKDAIVNPEVMAKKFEFHKEKCDSLYADLREAKQKLPELNNEIEKNEDELRKLLGKSLVKKSVQIALENATEENQQISLQLTYQVFGASWTPSYDIRVSTAETRAIKVRYYGLVKQDTGEEWRDVQLVLSTARPSFGGELPILGTLQASFVKEEETICFDGRPVKAKTTLFSYAMRGAIGANAESTPVPRAAHAMAVSQEGLLSTSFAIAKKTTIPSGAEKGHKVTIVSATLEAVQHFNCVPSKNTNVFLTATAINTTECPFLAGPASIFIDNCFNTKVNLEEVHSGGLFRCSLGVFPSIKVHYLPGHKFHKKEGWLMVGKSSKDTHEQRIIVKNAGKTAVLVTLREPIPRSTEKEIQIKLLSPLAINQENGGGNEGHAGLGKKESIASQSTSTTASDDVPNKSPKLPISPEEGAVIGQATGQLKWTISVGPGEKKELVVKYEVGYPHNEQVQFVEVFGH